MQYVLLVVIYEQPQIMIQHVLLERRKKRRKEKEKNKEEERVSMRTKFGKIDQ